MISIDDQALERIARTSTADLASFADDAFWQGLSDADFMRIAVLLAKKSRSEGGCPIGAVIIDETTRRIAGKGHNTLVQDGDPYNHGETAAIRDAGRIDFGKTAIFTSLSPCDVCAALIRMRGFRRVVIGDVTNASGNEDVLRAAGLSVDVLEDPEGIALYAKYRREDPDLDIEDWKGVAGVRESKS